MKKVKRLGSGQGLRLVGQFEYFNEEKDEVLVTFVPKDDGTLMTLSVYLAFCHADFFRTLKKGDWIDIPLSVDACLSGCVIQKYFS